ncbi:MAG: SHOCT domain-containing protein [Phycisphaerales bacterium]|nr:SHOCT domain-containing protein [Phycisphaerales bacterium]
MDFRVVWLVCAAVAIGVAAAILLYTARAAKLWARKGDAPSGEPFSLHDLRELQRRGEITPAEFEAMRGQLLAAHRRPSPPAGSATGGEPESQ